MSEIAEHIEHEGRFYILADAVAARTPGLVLKSRETFGVFDPAGDIEPRGHDSHGVFSSGMRHVSRWRTRFNGRRPLVLSSRVHDDNTRLIVDMTNDDLTENGHVTLPRGTLHLARTRFLWRDAWFERLVVSSYAMRPVDVAVSLRFECDFIDIFEVRGIDRAARGQMLAPSLSDGAVVHAYRGLDGIVRRTQIEFSPEPESLADHDARFRATLEPGGSVTFHVTIRFEPITAIESTSYRDNAAELARAAQGLKRLGCTIDSTNRPLTQWLKRSQSDIRMLLSETPEGLYPYAGVPWYSTPFGRDGIITALQTLWVNPDIARGVLQFLASTQAEQEDPERDAEPGKILHERRTDEMARTGEVPFGSYYGTVDATPLFVVLAAAYYEHTGDRAFLESIWPHVERALRWIDEFGDLDGDGFVEYRSRTTDGLGNQGWKDSYDSISHADGRLAEVPIALCEVQGYVFDAKARAAALANVLGREELAARLERESNELQQRFNQTFWHAGINSYALALDGRKRPCAVLASNAGHCLLSGIAAPEHAQAVCAQMLGKRMNSGWGIRTLAAGEARYNPMSYHNGSIWPHDNALIVAGLARYGFRDAVVRLFDGWFDAAAFFERRRLPELFCGFRRRRGKGPTLYPVACSPQAWASGAVFMLLAACLGLSIDGVNRQVRAHRPRLPRGINDLRIRGLRVGDTSLDLLFRRQRHDVSVHVLGKEGPVDLLVSK